MAVRGRPAVRPAERTAAGSERHRAPRELISRATGDPAARFNDPTVFAAQRRNVMLSRKTVDVEPIPPELEVEALLPASLGERPEATSPWREDTTGTRVGLPAGPRL